MLFQWGQRGIAVYTTCDLRKDKDSVRKTKFLFFKQDFGKVPQCNDFNVTFVNVILLNVRQETGDCVISVFSIQFCEDNLMGHYFPVRSC